MNICVFCGASNGNDPVYRSYAEKTGRFFSEQRITLVYGGGRVGLMGAVADGVLSGGGTAIGVMPRALVEREIAHPGLSELIVVESMHERKAKMAEMASAFIALPGGLGTLEEFFEQWTWAQLGIHHKPCALLNTKGYYTPIVTLLGKMVAEGFVKQVYADMLILEETIEPIVERIVNYEPPAPKWS